MVPQHLDESLSKFLGALSGFVEYVLILNILVKSLLVRLKLAHPLIVS